MYRNHKNTWRFAEEGSLDGGLHGEGDFLEEDDCEDETDGYSNLMRFIDLSAPCGGSINYSRCIHVNFVDINK